MNSDSIMNRLQEILAREADRRMRYSPAAFPALPAGEMKEELKPHQVPSLQSIAFQAFFKEAFELDDKSCNDPKSYQVMYYRWIELTFEQRALMARIMLPLCEQAIQEANTRRVEFYKKHSGHFFSSLERTPRLLKAIHQFLSLAIDSKADDDPSRP